MKILILTSLGFQKSVFKIIEYFKNENHETHVNMHKISIVDIKHYQPDLIITHNYKHIITQDIISFINNNIVNLHPSYLPYCRGLHPFLWSLINSDSQGVTLHFINEKIDEGNIIAQKKIYLKDNLTLREGYKIMQSALEDLFIEEWSNYDSWNKLSYPQELKGSYFSNRDFNKIKHLITDWDITLNSFKEKYHLFQLNKINP